MKKSEGEASEASAQAEEAFTRSSKLSTDQLITVEVQLAEERNKRIFLESELATMNAKIDQLLSRVKRLEAQVISLGAEPVR